MNKTWLVQGLIPSRLRVRSGVLRCVHVTRTVSPEGENREERSDRFMKCVRGVPSDVPEGHSSMNDRQASLVLIMFDPAPDILPLNGLMSFAPFQLIRHERRRKRPNFPEWCQ